MKNFAPDENPRRLSRHTQMSLAAAMLAMQDAGVTREEVRGLSPMVVTGTSIMDFDKIGKAWKTC